MSDEWVDTKGTRRQAVRRSMVQHPFQVLRGTVWRRKGLSERFAVPTSRDDVLRRVVAMPISTWTYGWDDETVKHLGPMSQDFARSFGLGDRDDRIALVDACGVSLCAIQALHKRVVALEAEVAALREGAAT